MRLRWYVLGYLYLEYISFFIVKGNNDESKYND